MARVFTVDFTGTESGSQFIRVPEGDYALEITKVVGKKGEDSGKPYLSIAFKLSEGDKRGNGKTINHTASLQPKALWNLRNILEACGKQVPSKSVKLDMDKMVGWKCAGTVIDDTPYEGKIKSVISAFFPIADLGNTSENADSLGEEQDGEEVFGEPAKPKGKGKAKEPETEEESSPEGDEADELFN